MSSFGFDLIKGIVSSGVGAFIGGCISLKISKATLNKETEKDISEVLLKLKENRQKIHNMHSDILTLRTQSLGADALKDRITEIVFDLKYRLEPISPVWDKKSSLIYTEYGEHEYNILKELVALIDELANIQSGKENSKALYDLDSDISGIKLTELYEKIESFFNNVKDRYISDKLKINR